MFMHKRYTPLFRRTVMRRVLALLVLLAGSFAAWAQQPTVSTTDAPAKKESRPRIGLVLEGGGALGLAHVGVLRWFEQHHIPIDDVAGTSLGALVGVLYSTGMSGEEIHQFFSTADWDRALRNATPYPDLSYRRKEDRRDYPNTLEFGLKNRISFPSG